MNEHELAIAIARLEEQVSGLRNEIHPLVSSHEQRIKNLEYSKAYLYAGLLVTWVGVTVITGLVLDWLKL